MSRNHWYLLLKITVLVASSTSYASVITDLDLLFILSATPYTVLTSTVILQCADICSTEWQDTIQIYALPLEIDSLKYYS